MPGTNTADLANIASPPACIELPSEQTTSPLQTQQSDNPDEIENDMQRDVMPVTILEPSSQNQRLSSSAQSAISTPEVEQAQQPDQPNEAEGNTLHNMMLGTLFEQIMQDQCSPFSVQSTTYIPEIEEEKREEYKKQYKEKEQETEESTPLQATIDDSAPAFTITAQKDTQPIQKDYLQRLPKVLNHPESAPCAPEQKDFEGSTFPNTAVGGKQTALIKNEQAAPLIIRPLQPAKRTRSQFGKQTTLVSIAVLILFVLFLSYNGVSNALRGRSVAASTATSGLGQQSSALLAEASAPVLRSAHIVTPSPTKQPTSTSTKKTVIQPRQSSVPKPTPTAAEAPVVSVAAPTPTPTPTPTPASAGVPTDNTTYELVNRNSGMALDVQYGSTTDGGGIIQDTDDGGSNQQWKLVTADTSGYFYLYNVNSGLVLDVPDGSTAEAVQLDQSDANGNASQQWQFVSTGDGYYTLVNLNSGLVADVQGASTDDGTAVIQWPEGNQYHNQEWQLVPVS